MLAMALPSPAGDDVAEVTWVRCDVDAESCWRRCYRGDLAMMRCRCQIMLAKVLPSHASDGATGATWPRCDIDVESCWRRCCRSDMAMT
jgi:hypothetical protein